jgi:ligand-binding sensor domain-containing protein
LNGFAGKKTLFLVSPSVTQAIGPEEETRMRKLRLPALPGLVLLLLLCGGAKAQYNTASFDHLSVEDGLSQSEVRSIYQDRKGFIWFGTVDGLNKYDGYSFQHFKHDPFDTTSLSNNEVVSICEDRNGNLWVGTVSGLSRLDQATGPLLPLQPTGARPT